MQCSLSSTPLGLLLLSWPFSLQIEWRPNEKEKEEGRLLSLEPWSDFHTEKNCPVTGTRKRGMDSLRLSWLPTAIASGKHSAS